MPPDPEIVDLIEQAFLQGPIDSLAAELAYLRIQAKRLDFTGQPENNVGLFVVPLMLYTNNLF